MLDKSIDGALLALRKKIIRGDGEGLEHVEALLVLRGVHMPRVPSERQCVAGKGLMRVMMLEALRSGPQSMSDLAAHVEARRPELTPEQAYKRAALALGRMQRAGLVVNEGGKWKGAT